jgi:AcrR family transcriptional regulator
MPSILVPPAPSRHRQRYAPPVSHTRLYLDTVLDVNARLSRAQSRQQTRDRLLAAAAELFAERGVNGTSVEQIVERAGYTRGAFYGNFDDKNDLVIDLLYQRTRRELEELRGLDELTLARLRQFNLDRATHLTGWLTLRLELVLHVLRNPELRPRLAERERLARDAISTGIANTLTTDTLRPPADPALLGLVAHALEDGLLIQKLLTPQDVPDDIVVDAYALLLRSWTALAEKDIPMTARTYRVTVRGTFDGLTDTARARLLADAADHDITMGGFTPQGSLTYDTNLRAFTFRYEVAATGEHSERDATADATARATSTLDAEGYGYKDLRHSTVDMQAIKIKRRT